MNVMATISRHNELMIDLDKNSTIFFLDGIGSHGYTQFSYAPMEMFKSNDSLQLA